MVQAYPRYNTLSQLSEILQQLQVQSGHFGLLLLSFSVIFCFFSSLSVSFIQAKLQPYEKEYKEPRPHLPCVHVVILLYPLMFLQGYLFSYQGCLFVFVIYKPFPKWFCNNQNKTCWKIVNTWQLPQAPKQALQLPLVRSKCILIRRSGYVITTLLKASHILLDKYL